MFQNRINQKPAQFTFTDRRRHPVASSSTSQIGDGTGNHTYSGANVAGVNGNVSAQKSVLVLDDSDDRRSSVAARNEPSRGGGRSAADRCASSITIGIESAGNELRDEKPTSSVGRKRLPGDRAGDLHSLGPSTPGGSGASLGESADRRTRSHLSGRGEPSAAGDNCSDDDGQPICMPRHHAQLYELYGAQADDFLHPKFEAERIARLMGPDMIARTRKLYPYCICSMCEFNFS